MTIGRVGRRARLWSCQAFCALGIQRLFETGFSGLGSILTFYRVAKVAPSHCYWTHKYSIVPDYLIQLIDMPINWDYSIVSMTEVGRRITGESPSTGRFVCLTFDDGYRDNYDVVLVGELF